MTTHLAGPLEIRGDGQVGDLGRYQVLAALAPMLRAKRRVLRGTNLFIFN